MIHETIIANGQKKVILLSKKNPLQMFILNEIIC